MKCMRTKNIKAIQTVSKELLGTLEKVASHRSLNTSIDGKPQNIFSFLGVDRISEDEGESSRNFMQLTLELIKDWGIKFRKTKGGKSPYFKTYERLLASGTRFPIAKQYKFQKSPSDLETKERDLLRKNSQVPGFK